MKTKLFDFRKFRAADVPAPKRSVTGVPATRKDIAYLFRAMGASDASGRRLDLVETELVKRGLTNQKALNAAKMERVITGEKTGGILVRQGLLSQKKLIDLILEVAPDEISSERITRSRIPLGMLRNCSILLTAETDTDIYVATYHKEIEVYGIVKEFYPEKNVHFVAYHPAQMSEFIARMEKLTTSDDDGFVHEEDRLDHLIFQAHDLGASDIHIVPNPNTFAVFFRKDGERRLVYVGPRTEYDRVRAQVKNRAGMDVAQDRMPQDGVFQGDFAGKTVDFRTVSFPVVHGEYQTLRLLDPDSVKLTLDKMGITRLAHWRRGFDQMDGLCLICGPTGSGKSTTLKTTMEELDRFGKSIFTIEDPVEYPLAYTGQIAVNRSVGLDFAMSIRTLMRADPDVINLQEVRDEETASKMMHAAETGHMVFATLHANDIRSAVSRLEHLGISAHDLRYSVRAIMVQNLVRTPCKECGGARCENCNYSGYSGRTIVSEVQSFSTPEEFDRMYSGEVFWPTRIEDAADKLEEGIVDMRELDRVYGSRIRDEVARRKAPVIELGKIPGERHLEQTPAGV